MLSSYYVPVLLLLQVQTWKTHGWTSWSLWLVEHHRKVNYMKLKHFVYLMYLFWEPKQCMVHSICSISICWWNKNILSTKVEVNTGYCGAVWFKEDILTRRHLSWALKGWVNYSEYDRLKGTLGIRKAVIKSKAWGCKWHSMYEDI